MERTDLLHAGIDASQARFLMLTAMTHHNFGSAAWGQAQVRRLYAELTAIDAAAAEVIPADCSSLDGQLASPADRPPATRLRRLLGWLRLDSRRDRDVRPVSPPISRTD